VQVADMAVHLAGRTKVQETSDWLWCLIKFAALRKFYYVKGWGVFHGTEIICKNDKLQCVKWTKIPC
jgi:hypothetical protein